MWHLKIFFMNRIKIVLVGEPTVGKTSLCNRYAEGCWSDSYGYKTWPNSSLDDGIMFALFHFAQPHSHVFASPILHKWLLMIVCWCSKMATENAPDGRWYDSSPFRAVWHTLCNNELGYIQYILCGDFLFSGKWAGRCGSINGGYNNALN